MLQRNRILAALALTVLTTAQALAAATFGTIAYTPPYDPRIRIVCYTQAFFTATTFIYMERKCDAGQRPLSVKTVSAA